MYKYLKAKDVKVPIYEIIGQSLKYVGLRHLYFEVSMDATEVNNDNKTGKVYVETRLNGRRFYARISRLIIDNKKWLVVNKEDTIKIPHSQEYLKQIWKNHQKEVFGK
jgi:hypothetical protein